MARLMSRAVPLAALVLAAITAPAVAQTTLRQVPQSQQEITLSFAPLVKRVSPAVVNIYTKREVVQRRQQPRMFEDPFFRRFFGDQLERMPNRRRMQNALGSGVIVQADGVVVTNNHVIADADEITVVLSDRREYDARVLLADDRTDLAILKIETGGEQLAALAFADSDAVEVGDLVLAVGNPFGVGQTVTSGIVSATARTQIGVTDYQFFIQTDAAINPGNSGGALVGMDGRLIGINTAIYSRTGGSVGIGFATPVNMVRLVVDSALKGGGRIVRPWLGAFGQPVTADIARSLGLDRPGGVLVSEVLPGSPAGRAGLRQSDVITAIDGFDIADPAALKFRLGSKPLGGTVDMTVVRRGTPLAVAVALEAAPEDPPREETTIAGRTPFSGALVANLSPAVAEEYGFDPPYAGVVIVEPGRGAAAQIGLRSGDRVLEVNGREISTVRDLVKAAGGKAREWRIQLRRANGRVENLFLR